VTVSALMATTSKRAAFRPRALECFYQQIFPAGWRLELIVDQNETDTLGTKLNRMTASTDADYLITYDDDDFHSPTRIARQIQPLIDGYQISGTSKIFYHDVVKDEGWLYSNHWYIWMGGMAWRRSCWDRLKFMDRTVGVDTRYQHALRGMYPPEKFAFDVADPALFIASMHPGNSCPKNTAHSLSWSRATLPDFPRIRL
jgi:hypothetical protein